MTLHIFKNYQELSAHTADIVIHSLKENPELVLCMASGSTPSLLCDLLVKKLKAGETDFSRFSFIGLDEWVGLSLTNTGSCHYFFQSKIFEPLQLKPEQYYLFDACATDLQQECKKMDKHIAQKGGIDIMIVGIGLNGHIGFNEPGTSFESLSHVATLDEITKKTGQQKYFNEPVVLDKGITIGLGHLMNSRKVLLMANGSKKAEVIKKAAEGTVAESFPASIIQRHQNGFIFADAEAASLLD
jgi:galactosamine-6-phosphate isomerase